MAKKLWKPKFNHPTGTKVGKFYVFDTGLRKFYKKGFATAEAAREARQIEIDHFKESQQVDLTDHYEIYQKIKP